MAFLSTMVLNFVLAVFGQPIFASQTHSPDYYVPDYNNESTLADGRSYILKTKMVNYNPNVPPMPGNNSFVNVLTNFVLLSLLEVDEQGQSMTTNGYFELEWIDNRLAWDNENYNINYVYYKHKEIWHPDVTVMNTVEKVKTMSENEFQTLVSYNGTVLWNPGDIYKTSCDLEITYFPFDAQVCDLVVSPWMSSFDVSLSTHPHKPYTRGIGQNSMWNIESVTKKNEMFDSTQSVKIVLVLKRCPGYYLLNLLLPVLLFAGLVSLVFVMPLGHSDRVSFAVTILLSFVVFMTFLNETLPKTSRHLSVIAVYVMCLFLISGLSVGLAICSLKIGSYPQSKPVPTALICLFGCQRMKQKNKTAPGERKSQTLSTEGDDDLQGPSATWMDVSRAVDSILMATMLCVIVGVSAVAFGIIAVKSKHGVYFAC